MIPLPSRSIVRWIALALVVVLVAIMGFTALTYHLLLETSEDAYATTLYKRAAKRIRDLDFHLRSTLIRMEKEGNALAPPPQGGGKDALPTWARSFGDDISDLILVDAQGHIQSAWADHGRTTPETLTIPEILAKRLEQKGAFITNGLWLGQTCLYLHAPRFDDSRFAGTLTAVIPISRLAKRWIPKSDEPLIAEFWIVDDQRHIIAGMSRDGTRTALEPAFKRQPLISEPEAGDEVYRVTSQGETRQLVVSVPLLLPGVRWSIECAMDYSTIQLAPRALFKSLVIVMAWLLPMLGIVILYLLRNILTFIEHAEMERSRHEREEVQAQLLGLIDVIPTPIYVAETQEAWTFHFISNPITALTGCAPVEFMADARLWLRLVHPDDRTAVAAARQSARQTHTIRTVNYRFKHAQGHWLRLSERIGPIGGDGFHHIMGLITTQDTLTPNPPALADTPGTPQAIIAPRPSPALSPDRQRAGSPPSKPHILLVDDDRLLVNVSSQWLWREGFGITPAYDGMDAVRLYTETPSRYDAVVLDMVMPRMSGLEAIQHLRKVNPDVRIVCTSGYSKDGLEWDLKRCGVNHFLTKPFQPEDLCELLRNLIAETVPCAPATPSVP